MSYDWDFINFDKNNPKHLAELKAALDNIQVNNPGWYRGHNSSMILKAASSLLPKTKEVTLYFISYSYNGAGGGVVFHSDSERNDWIDQYTKIVENITTFERIQTVTIKD